MSKLSENYIAVNEGRMARSEFVRQARQSYPQAINQYNTFDDTVSILRRKGLLSEEVVKACQVNPDSLKRGIRYELDKAGVCPVEGADSEDLGKAREKAVNNLCKDPQYYLKLVQKGEMSLAENRKIKLHEGTDDQKARANRTFFDYYVKYKDGKYQVKDPETDESKPGKKLAPETAAKKACLLVRRMYNNGYFRPDRITLRNCAFGRGKLQYMGEREENGKSVPCFNYSWSISESKRSKEEKILKECVARTVSKILNEAATANLAKLSDDNASIQGIPAILNSLENIVTEIESFILKEQEKIQGVFDTIGNIKNEDNIPIGYKFVSPIMDALKKDLEPVLSKVSLDNVKLPEAPQSQDAELTLEPEDQEAMDDMEPKETVFSPSRRRAEQPLQESEKKVVRRYTK